MLAALLAVVAMAAAAPGAGAQTLTVTPSTGLPDSATVQLSGTGWTGSDNVTVEECVSFSLPPPPFCRLLARPRDTFSSGTFGPAPVQLLRVFTLSGLPSQDCGTVQCYVQAAGSLVDPPQFASVPITFANSGAQSCAGKPVTLAGTAGDDDLTGTGGADVIAAGGGEDHVSGLGGNDLICGNAGNDTLIGGAGKDTLLGQGGRDVCKGGKGSDSGKCEVERSV